MDAVTPIGPTSMRYTRDVSASICQISFHCQSASSLTDWWTGPSPLSFMSRALQWLRDRKFLSQTARGFCSYCRSETAMKSVDSVCMRLTRPRRVSSTTLSTPESTDGHHTTKGQLDGYPGLTWHVTAWEDSLTRKSGVSGCCTSTSRCYHSIVDVSLDAFRPSLPSTSMIC